MILWDVNLWVYAFRKDSPAHDQSRKVILETLEGSDSFLFCPHVAASFLRLVTNRRILKKPSDIREAWEFIDTLESHPNARYAEVDRMTFGIFKHLVLANLSAGNTIPDVLLAALGVRYNCAFLTADREFPRLPGLEIRIIG